jgi:hypothetical protein
MFMEEERRRRNLLKKRVKRTGTREKDKKAAWAK